MNDIASLREPLGDALTDALLQKGYAALTSVQSRVLESAAETRDLRVSSQTGSGKTVALGIAVREFVLGHAAARKLGGHTGAAAPATLVITPTRELAHQVEGELTWLFAKVPARVASVTGGASYRDEKRNLAMGPSIVVGTPGRLLDHLKQGIIDASTTQAVVLDEADRMLDMGFREDLEAIVAALPAERRSHLVSATFPPQVRRLADSVQGDALVIQGTMLGVANDDIEHVASIVERGDTYAAVVNALLLAHGQKVLVFVERRVDAGELADRLVAEGFAVQSLSGDLSQAQRNRALEAFRSGVADVLVSTDVGARGLDVPDISLVIQIDAPKDPDDYTHRSGRTGRAGRKGRSLLLVGPREQARARSVLRAAKVEVSWRPLPTPDEIRESIAERTRAKVLEQLERACTPRAAAQAAALLDGRDPVRVVASLLSLAGSDLPCDPKPVRNPSEARPRPAARAKHTRHTGTFVRFSINWGHRKGATPSRLLSHLCRRGEIDSGMVGSIEIGPGSATFEVADHVAGNFEQRVREPDRRDPGLRIARSNDAEG